MNKKIKIELELDPVSVEYIELNAQERLKKILEDEINNNPDSFIEMLGLDSW